jgi:hypothetical protein
MRGRIRERLCPELQALRYELAYARTKLDIEFDNGRRQAEREWEQRLKSMRAVAELYKESYHGLLKMISKAKAMEPGCPVFLATPPQGSPPTRRPLTDEAIWRQYQALWPFHLAEESRLAKDIVKFARAIEAAHGIKEPK